jgi:formate dehydrogenase assembly factor FdhD
LLTRKSSTTLASLQKVEHSNSKFKFIQIHFHPNCIQIQTYWLYNTLTLHLCGCCWETTIYNNKQKMPNKKQTHTLPMNMVSRTIEKKQCNARM